MLRRSSWAGTSWTSVPRTKIWPDVGSMSRLIIFRVVVLPHPEGPTRTTSSPAGMVRLRLRTAGALPPGKTLETASIRMAGSAERPGFVDTVPPRSTAAPDAVMGLPVSTLANDLPSGLGGSLHLDG